MRQFHVFRRADGRLLLDLQSDRIDTPTRVVALLTPAEEARNDVPHLRPRFQIEGRSYILQTTELAAVRRNALPDEPLADLSEAGYVIQRALDTLFSTV